MPSKLTLDFRDNLYKAGIFYLFFLDLPTSFLYARQSTPMETLVLLC